MFRLEPSLVSLAIGAALALVAWMITKGPDEPDAPA